MPRNRLSKMRITRVSLVDRPAGVGAEVVLAKRDEGVEKAERFFSEEERSKMAEKDIAMPDGSFPIPDADALRRAIQSIGRAKNRAAVVRHIKQRAKDLDCMDMVAGLSSVAKEEAGDGIHHEVVKNNSKDDSRGNMSQAVVGKHEQGANVTNDDDLEKGMSMEDEASSEDMTEDMAEESARPKRKKMAKSEETLDAILKSLPEEAVSYIERLEDLILDMQESGFEPFAKDDDEDDEDDEDGVEEDDADDAEVEYDEDDAAFDEDDYEDVEDADDADEPVTKFFDGDDEDLVSILKGADARLARVVKSYVDRAEQKAEKATAIAKRERDLRLHREYVAKAADLSAIPAKQEDLVTLMTVVADKAPEIEEVLTSVLKAAHGALKESILYKSEGSDALDNNTAIAKFDAVVKEIRGSNPSMSAEQAFAKALDSHPELYDEYLNSNTFNKGR